MPGDALRTVKGPPGNANASLEGLDGRSDASGAAGASGELSPVPVCRSAWWAAPPSTGGASLLPVPGGICGASGGSGWRSRAGEERLVQPPSVAPFTPPAEVDLSSGHRLTSPWTWRICSSRVRPYPPAPWAGRTRPAPSQPKRRWPALGAGSPGQPCRPGLGRRLSFGGQGGRSLACCQSASQHGQRWLVARGHTATTRIRLGIRSTGPPRGADRGLGIRAERLGPPSAGGGPGVLASATRWRGGAVCRRRLPAGRGGSKAPTTCGLRRVDF
jgi:hypothetical protein